MKKSLSSSIVYAGLFPAYAIAQHPCTEPAVLRITKTGADIFYQVNTAKPHKLYTLGEVSAAVEDCTPERVLFIVATPEVPVGLIHAEPKEQIENIRYFVEFPNGNVEELGRDLYYARLPITPDILPEAPRDDAPPTSAPNTKGTK